MNFLRNSPWLVLLFAMLYIIPFEVHVFGLSVPFPPFRGSGNRHTNRDQFSAVSGIQGNFMIEKT